jgi:hypothetical protein
VKVIHSLLLGFKFGGAVASFLIKSSWLHPYPGGDVEKPLGVVWFSRTSSSYGDLQIVKNLNQRLFLLCLWNACGLLDPFGDFPYTTNNIRPAQGGAASRH